MARGRQQEDKQADITIPCENLAFGGGGAPGVFAYAQAIKQLRLYVDLGKVKRVVGTSVGSIAALMVTLRYTDQEINDFLAKLELAKVDDGGNWVSKARRMLNTLGLLKGEELDKLIHKILTNKGLPKDATFDDLRKAGFATDLHITVSKIKKENNVAKLEKVYFCHDNAAHSPVADICKASAAATPFFAPVVLEHKSEKEFRVVKDKDKQKGHFSYTDGGFVETYSIRRFDLPKYGAQPNQQEDKNRDATFCNHNTIGLALIDPEIDPTKPSKTEPVSTDEFASTVYAMLEGEQPQLLKLRESPQDYARTITIDRCGVSLQEFNLSQDKQEKLKRSATLAVRTFVSARASDLRKTQATQRLTDAAHQSDDLFTRPRRQVDPRLFATDEVKTPASDIPVTAVARPSVQLTVAPEIKRSTSLRKTTRHPLAPESRSRAASIAASPQIESKQALAEPAPLTLTPVEEKHSDFERSKIQLTDERANEVQHQRKLQQRDALIPKRHEQLALEEKAQKERERNKKEKYVSRILTPENPDDAKSEIPGNKWRFVGVSVSTALATTGAVLGTAAALASNPVGWVVAFAGCLAALAATVTFCVKIYNRYTKNKKLNQFPEAIRKLLYVQNQNLKEDNFAKTPRHTLMEKGFLLSRTQDKTPLQKNLQQDSLVCDMYDAQSGARIEAEKPLFFNRRSGQLFFETPVMVDRKMKVRVDYQGTDGFTEQLKKSMPVRVR